MGRKSRHKRNDYTATEQPISESVVELVPAEPKKGGYTQTKSPLSQAAMEALYDQHGGHFDRVDLEGLSEDSVTALRSYFIEHFREKLDSLSLDEAVELSESYGCIAPAEIINKAQTQKLEQLVAMYKNDMLWEIWGEEKYRLPEFGGSPNRFLFHTKTILEVLSKGYIEPYTGKPRDFTKEIPIELKRWIEPTKGKVVDRSFDKYFPLALGSIGAPLTVAGVYGLCTSNNIALSLLAIGAILAGGVFDFWAFFEYSENEFDPFKEYLEVATSVYKLTEKLRKKGVKI